MLVVNNLKYQFYKETIIDDQLTPNRVMLIGLFEILNKLPNKQKVIIITGTPLGFSKTINIEDGINYDYVYAVLNMIEHKDHDAVIYSFMESNNEIVDLIRNPDKYKLKQK